MNRISTYISILSLSFIMGACVSDDLNNETILSENGEVTQIEAISLPFDFGDSDARTAITMGNNYIDLPVWAEGDTIGIYPSAGGDQLSFPITDGVGTNTCVFTGGGWALKTSTPATTYTYTAYTPFDRSYYLRKDNTALPFSMLGQKQVGNNNSDHLGAYDLQIANGDTPTSGKISFAFQHKVAIVRMDITAPNAANWKSITLKSLADFTVIANINLSIDNPTVTPTDKSYSVTLDLENVSTTADNLQIVAYMMMLPVDFTNKTLNMELMDVDGNVYTAPVSIDNPTNVANPLIFGEANARWISAEFEEVEESVREEDIPYLTFSADLQQTLKMSSSIKTLEYSVNNGEWKSLGTTTVSFGAYLGDLRLRGKRKEGTYEAKISFGNTVPVSCSGDIRTLVDYERYNSTSTSEAVFKYLFKDCTQLISTPALSAKTLAASCYFQMFSGCTNLTETPELPATVLATSCYSNMFENCTNLTKIASLPATTLASSCYKNMFAGCTALEEMPSLPATTLAESCYENMFGRCTSLTKAISLPATTLANNCYSQMFWNCTALQESPDLPATTLADGCYSRMFEGCVGLTETPLLPATVLAPNCYSEMFRDCTNLVKASSLPATTLAQGCYSLMFAWCHKLTEIPSVLPAITLADECYRMMFIGCINLTTAPSLPATTLAKGCYKMMFIGCPFTTAPVLPATTLVDECYYQMFYGCTKLNEVKMLATNVKAYSSDYLTNWLKDVASSGTITITEEMITLPTGNSGIPNGWAVLLYEE